MGQVNCKIHGAMSTSSCCRHVDVAFLNQEEIQLLKVNVFPECFDFESFICSKCEMKFLVSNGGAKEFHEDILSQLTIVCSICFTQYLENMADACS